ncbi:MAG: hypothetical protein AAF242_09815 [Bacteroidota bacterium]
MIKTLKYYLGKETILGYGSSTSFFLMEHFEAIGGMILSIVMIVYSIILQRKRIQVLQNEERRREEKHQQALMQDQEIHEQALKNQQWNNSKS